MWNDPAAPAPHAYDDSTGHGDIAWSPGQMARLEGEWRRLQRAYAYHPHVTLSPLKGDPPSEYQVDYRVTTLAIDQYNNLEYAQTASVHIWLPPGFPDQPPVVRPMTNVYHPNVTWEGFYLTSAWHPSETLLGLVRKVGELLAYRTFDPDAVANPGAMDWLNANAHVLPLDGAADLSPGAGGEPLARVCRFGEGSIAAMRQSLQTLQQSLLSQSAPDAAATRDFARRTRSALNLFLENDVPDSLRAAASELDECAREVPQDIPSYDYLRSRRAAMAALRASVKAMQEARPPLQKELDRLAAQVDAGEPTEATVALKLIPEMKVIQPFQLSMPKWVADADRRVAAVKSQLNVMASVKEPQVIPSDSFMGRRLEAEFAAVGPELAAARREAEGALASFEALVARAKADYAALERVARWREYVDMISRGRALERRVAEWGADGVQAYYIENESGTFGPFQYEQPVDLGGGDVVVRNVVRGAIEVRDPAREVVLGESQAGAVKVDIPGPAAEESLGGDGGDDGPPKRPAFATTFRLSERCDDLLVQFDFLRRQTAENLQQQTDAAALGSTIWCGQFCQLLAEPSSRKELAKELNKVAIRWRHAMMDLAALSPYKERLATYFLLARASEGVPPLVAALRGAKAGLKESEKRLADIARYCSRDVETDRMVVPPKYSAAYNKEMALRKEAGETIERSTELLKSVVQQLTTRLKAPKLLGRAGTPSMRVLSPVPETTEALPLADGQLGEQIVRLEELLKRPLGGPRPAPPSLEPAAAAVPVAAPLAEVPAGSYDGDDGSVAEGYADVEQAAEVGYAEQSATAEPVGPVAADGSGGSGSEIQAAEGVGPEGTEYGADAAHAGDGGFVSDGWEGEAAAGESDDSIGFQYEPEPQQQQQPRSATENEDQM